MIPSSISREPREAQPGNISFFNVRDSHLYQQSFLISLVNGKYTKALSKLSESSN